MATSFGKKLRKGINNARQDVGSFMADVFDGASGNKAKRERFKQLADDMRVLREAKAAGSTNFPRTPESLSNPKSMARRQMRVNSFERQARSERQDEDPQKAIGAGAKAARDLFRKKVKRKQSKRPVGMKVGK